ncbi:MAG: putative membrane protein YdgH [Candidatus Heimdallarchaeota archaeon LC_3]|nr:MAG: putative membrane protein YdgH [Candidatus Heimdallarchaeota archaeon LC_3]
MDNSNSFNPFEKIAKFNQKNFRSIAFFAFITVILMIPLAISAFQNTSSATTSFLSGNLESLEVNEILEREFPDRSESSLIIIIEDKNNNTILSDDSLGFLLDVADTLQRNDEIGDKIEISSIASIEADVQQAFDDGLTKAEQLIEVSLTDPLTALADNLTNLKTIYSNISTLATSIEQMGSFTDIFAFVFYDLARGAFYLNNITQAYDSYFNYTDYAKIEQVWDTTFSPMNKLMVLQSYVGTFHNISQIEASPIFADAFLNSLTFNLLNFSIYNFHQLDDQLNTTPYLLSPLYQILLGLNQSWVEAFNSYIQTLPTSSVYGNFLGNDTFGNNMPSINLSQLIIVSYLKDIAQTAFPSFFNSLLTLQAQGGFGSDSLNFGSFDTQAMLNIQVNNSIIESLHLFPLGYMQLWIDVARSIYYLGNLTSAYEDATTFIGFPEIGTVQAIIENLGWAFDPAILIGTYNYTSIPIILNTKLGNITYNQVFSTPSLADNTINGITFELFNLSLFSQYSTMNPGNPLGYFSSEEYFSLLVFNSTWNYIFSKFTIFDQISDELKLVPSIGQFSMLNKMLPIANTSFVSYVSSSFEMFTSNIDTNSSSGSLGARYGLTIENQSHLEIYATLFSQGLLSSFITTGINITDITPLLSTNIVPLAVEYRYNSSIPENLLKPAVLELISTIIFGSETNVSITDLFVSGGTTSFTSLFEPYLDNITNAANFSLIISQLYDTTVINSTITVAEISSDASKRIITELRSLIPVPTIENSFGQDSESFSPILKGFVSTSNKTTLIFVTFPGIKDEEELNSYVDVVREDLHNLLVANGVESKYAIWVTGGIAIGFDTDTSLEEDISTVDRVTIVLVLILLTIVFLSVIAPAVPLAGIGMAIMSALGTIYVLSEILDIGIPSIMISLLTVTMMGAGVDYCLFVMWRYKEERQRGVNKYSAVRQSVIHAGESVASSGATVMIGFGSLLLSSFSLLNQMGFGPMIGIGFSLLAALTIIPIGLYLFGDNLFWPRNFRKDYEKKLAEKGINQADIRQGKPIPIQTMKKNNKKEPFLRRMAKFTVKHPVLIILGFAVISVPFVYEVSRIEISYDSVDFLPQGVEAVEGLKELQGDFSLGRLFPLQVVLDFNNPISDAPNSSFYNLDKLVLIDQFVEDLYAEFSLTSDGRIWIDEIDTITRPYGTRLNLNQNLDVGTIAQMKQFIGPISNTTIIVNVLVGFDIEPLGAEALQLVGAIRGWRDDYNGFGSEEVDVYVGGSVSQFYEISNIINQETPFLMAAVMIGIFIVLFFITGSIFTPIRLEATILLSIIMAMGAVQFYFVDILGQGIPWMIPIMLFVLIFGLGMDYDIFIVTRMREEVALRGATDEEAIIIALEKTGTIILAAGVIMASSLGSLFLAQSNILKIMGFAFFFAILLDATLIRQLLVPAMMVLAKRANWWNPIKSLQRVPNDSERARLRQIHAERVESDLVFNDLDDDELKYYEKDFKKDVSVISRQKNTLIGLTQVFWKSSNREKRQMANKIDLVKTVIHNIESKYEEFRPEIRNALYIYVDTNIKAILEVKSLMNQLSEALGFNE